MPEAGKSPGLSSFFTTGREVAARLPIETVDGAPGATSMSALPVDVRSSPARRCIKIAVEAVISSAEAAVFRGIPVISMYLQAHPVVDAFIQRSSRPVALALAGAAVVAGLVSRYSHSYL
jgi:hypothetical protein